MSIHKVGRLAMIDSVVVAIEKEMTVSNTERYEHS